MSHQTFWKPEKKVKEPKQFGMKKKKERKPVAEWKKDILSHHRSKYEANQEGDEVISLAFKECNECGWSDLIPVRTKNCQNCKTKGSLINKPEGLKKSKERLCECGCGEKVYVPKRFVSGHNGRLNSKEGTYRRDGRSFTMINCSHCGKRFERRADQVNRHGLKNYCSKECMGAVQSSERKGKPIFALRKGHNHTCKQCGDEFYVPLGGALTGRRKFCSKVCFGKWQIDHPSKNFIGSADNRGEKNGMYKHGKRVGGHISKRKVRLEVIERDGNWCMICGKPGPGLHLHRVIYGSQGGKYQADNNVLACAEHHAMFHSNKKLWQPFLLAYLKAASEETELSKKISVDITNQQNIRDLTVRLGTYSLKNASGYGHFDD